MGRKYYEVKIIGCPRCKAVMIKDDEEPVCSACVIRERKRIDGNVEMADYHKVRNRRIT